MTSSNLKAYADQFAALAPNIEALHADPKFGDLAIALTAFTVDLQSAISSIVNEDSSDDESFFPWNHKVQSFHEEQVAEQIQKIGEEKFESTKALFDAYTLCTKVAAELPHR